MLSRRSSQLAQSNGKQWHLDIKSSVVNQPFATTTISDATTWLSKSALTAMVARAQKIQRKILINFGGDNENDEEGDDDDDDDDDDNDDGDDDEDCLNGENAD